MARKDINSYFSHDSNARNDDKLIRLRMKHGAAGYGVYFMILERLREETDYMSIKDYNMIAFDFRVDSSLVKSVIEDFGLFAFTEDGKCFYSESFMRRMEIKDTVRNKRKDAAAKRWGKSPEDNQSEKEQKKLGINIKTEPTQKSKSTPIPVTGSAALPGKEPPVVPPAPVPAPSVPPRYSASIDDEVAEMKRSSQWKETVCIRYNLPPEKVDFYLGDFALKCNKQHNSLQDAKSHFCYWLQEQIQKPTQYKHQPTPTDNSNPYEFKGGFGGKDQ